MVDASIENYDKVKSELHRGACCKLLDTFYRLNKKGEKLLFVNKLELVGKSISFPNEYPKNQIKDPELIVKNRTLHYITNISAYKNLVNRTIIINGLKNYFLKKGALEVDLPVLEQVYGGALAKPFTTLCNYNKKNYFLRISLQLPLKRLIISGMPQVYSIGPCFRNEGLDKTHTFEYTHFQYYTTHHSYKEVQKMVEQVYWRAYKEMHGVTSKYDFDLTAPWPCYYKEDIEKLLRKHQVSTLDQLMENKLLGPFFHVQGWESNPLAVNPYIWDSYVDYDLQICTGYQEENNSLELTRKLKETPSLKNMVDPKFVEELGYGMPETVGLGIGVDRLVKSVLGASSIKETQTFPHI